MEFAFDRITIAYHNIFDYPLTIAELKKWKSGNKFLISKAGRIINSQLSIKTKQNFYFLDGRQDIIKKRLKNERYSQKKLIIAKNATKLVSKIPTVKFVGITGALAMMNASKDSDIDLIIITKQNTLWTTRFLVYGLLRVAGYKLRSPNQKDEKNKLCLNMWLDESDLIWNKKDRNIYTAHEITQIVPLVNKDKTYEKFLYLNRWILDYWPNAVKVPYAISNKQSLLLRSKPYGKETINFKAYGIKQLTEKLTFNIQYFYMKDKITREVVTSTRAIFHPNDWGKIVLGKLSS